MNPKIATSSLTLGILGGGQLGRMSAIAAAQLGIAVVIFTPEENSPASLVAKDTIVAPYNDKDALRRFSEMTDIISYEFENIPVKTVEYLNSLKSDNVFPDEKLLLISQDRIKEKTFLNDSGITTARWAHVNGLSDIQKCISDWNLNSFILKTARFGYDGKGQIKCDALSIENNTVLATFLDATKEQDIILEEVIPFSCEISIIAARDNEGKTSLYGPMLNAHKNHILDTTTVPSGVSKTVSERAVQAVMKIADAVNLRGVLTVELFVCEDETVLANEIAPRTHNSGHWTIDACAVSQFENHVRTACGMPVGSADRHSDAVMLNLIGDDVNTIAPYLTQKDTCVHLYGKTDIREGRKMGHITTLKPKTDD